MLAEAYASPEAYEGRCGVARRERVELSRRHVPEIEGIVKDGWAGRPIQPPIGHSSGRPIPPPIGRYPGRPIPLTASPAMKLEMLDRQGLESIIHPAWRLR